MIESDKMPEFEAGIPPQHAVSVYNNDAPEDFPVLKAFQQYIDAEQAKARKRMLSLSIFFGVLMTIVIAFFLFMLNSATNRNQALNDRLIELVLNNKAQERQAAVVVNSPQDQSTVLALTAKIDEMQQKLLEAQQQAVAAEQARTEAAQQAAAKAAKDHEEAALALEKRRTQEALEVERLKALLAAEREKAAAEREKQREAELEAYRRKHYPEFYAKKEQQPEPEAKPVVVKKVKKPAPVVVEEEDDDDDSIEAIIDELSGDDVEDDVTPISYFEEEENLSTKKKNYAIPVEVKGSRNKWRIPNE